ncbi:MAG: hypothetical protein ABI471_06990 [Sphingomonas bacterium]
MRTLILACLLALTPAQLMAQSTASGTYAEGDVTIPLSHGVALRKDDSEGILFDEAGIWILLSNAEAGPQALAGGLFPPVYGMAKQGKLQGLLFVIKPGDHNALSISVLATQDREQGSFRTLSLSKTPALWEKLVVGPHRISGTLVSGETHFSFDLLIAENPITADLHGAAAQASPQLAVLMANARAWIAGDLDAVKATISHRKQAEIDGYTAAQRTQLAAQAGPDMRALLAAKPKLDRVVVRGDTASIKTPDGGAFDFTREDGVWKLD